MIDRAIRWAVVLWTIWRGRSKQDDFKPHPRHSRWAWHWSRTWWEAGFRYAPSDEFSNAIWTRRVGLFIDWRRVGQAITPDRIKWVMTLLSPWPAAAIFKLLVPLSAPYLALVTELYRAIGLILIGYGCMAALAWCARWAKGRIDRWRWRRRRRWEPVGDPTPRHWNCRCAVVPMSELTSFDDADRRPIADAPRDVVILGHYPDGTIDRIRWEEDRRCAGDGPMSCQGEGWVSLDAGGLPVDEPPEWQEESNLTGCLDPDLHQGRCGYSRRHDT